MTGAMGSHQSHRALTTTWLTPPHILDALGPFDLDPCGHPDWPTARRRVTLPDDGLAADWSGRVWLNPPYGREVWEWLAKLAAHGDGIALVFARTETEGFVREVWGKADAILFLQHAGVSGEGSSEGSEGSGVSKVGIFGTFGESSVGSSHAQPPPNPAFRDWIPARVRHGRLHFHRADGTRAEANAGAPSCLVAYGQDNVAALASCGLPGTLVRWEKP